MPRTGGHTVALRGIFAQNLCKDSLSRILPRGAQSRRESRVRIGIPQPQARTHKHTNAYMGASHQKDFPWESPGIGFQLRILV